jgi:acetate kinase
MAAPAAGLLLVLNAGSSSLKFALDDLAAPEPCLRFRGQIAGIGTAPRLELRDAAGSARPARPMGGPETPREALLDAALDLIEAEAGGGRIAAAGHRIVHGGTRFDRAVRIDAEVLSALEALVPLAPLHQPHNLAPVRTLAALRPGLPQTASFDTAFHRGHDPVVDRFALPRALEAAGIRRYGFHGLSYAFIAGHLARAEPALAGRRTVVAHLGAGASLCALRDGRSLDTTMGFTALDGLPMATRPGALDPGVLLHLMTREGMGPAELQDLLYHRSGLLGVSGLSGDMRELLASPDPRAADAVDLFAFRVARETAALAATLGGLEVMVFTAGIGERSAAVRANIAARLGWLGLTLDGAANAAGARRISAPGSAVAALVIPTDEEAVIAAEARALLGRGA